MADSATENDRFARWLGIQLLETSPGRARTCLPIRDELRNGIGTAHGGAIFALADYTFAVAANSGGRLAVALSASIDFLRPGLEGSLTAEAAEISGNRKVGHYQVKICNDAAEVVAVFTGLAYYKAPVAD